MRIQVDVDEAQTRLCQLLDQAAAGEEVIIARNGRPVVQLVWIADDFDEPDQEMSAN